MCIYQIIQLSLITYSTALCILKLAVRTLTFIQRHEGKKFVLSFF